jgi:NADP-dependent 3-hydroxy acid dehydrogenase YdfG
MSSSSANACRTVMITGAAQGIGRAIAETCLERGSAVAAIDLDGDAAPASIVNISSDAGRRGTIGQINYAAAKAWRRFRSAAGPRRPRWPGRCAFSSATRLRTSPASTSR